MFFFDVEAELHQKAAEIIPVKVDYHAWEFNVFVKHSHDPIAADI
jgi:hypothetical protein